MRIRVVAFGALREMAGIDRPGESIEVELAEGASVAETIEALGLPAGLVYSILLDGERIEPSVLLRDGAELTLMPAFTGGR